MKKEHDENIAKEKKNGKKVVKAPKEEKKKEEDKEEDKKEEAKNVRAGNQPLVIKCKN